MDQLVENPNENQLDILVLLNIFADNNPQHSQHYIEIPNFHILHEKYRYICLHSVMI